MVQLGVHRVGGIWVVLVGLLVMPGMAVALSSVALSADPVVGWQDVQSAVDAVSLAGSNLPVSKLSGDKSGLPASEMRAAAAFELRDRVGPGLPPPPRVAAAAASHHVHPGSLAGISSSVVPAVTGDLYWSRPMLDMRVIGQSLGHNSSLRLTRPSVGASVGANVPKPALVGIK